MGPSLPALEELWDSIGEVLRVSPSQKIWSFSTPDDQVARQELLQLAQLGRILEELPIILRDCGLQGNAQKMFLQSVTVFQSPPEKILNAAASSLLVLEQHWSASAWQEAGSKLGLLMQDMLLDTFPETVHFDGRLRTLKTQGPGQGATTHVVFLCLCAGLAVPVTGLAAARGWNVPRIVRAMFEIRQVRCDTCEEGRRGQAVEEIQIEVNRIRRLEMSGLLEEEETVEDFHESFAAKGTDDIRHAVTCSELQKVEAAEETIHRTDLIAQGFQDRELRYRGNIAAARDQLLDYAQEYSKLQAALRRSTEDLSLLRDDMEVVRDDFARFQRNSEEEEDRDRGALALLSGERKELERKLSELKDRGRHLDFESNMLRSRAEQVRERVANEVAA
ncbi:SLC8A2 [Symbiodinium natans]|uniref:SLC8A2 protein n=1 Tax=Symbiodinium natans TaxID=878477 RepID=A0A812NDP2_9DINO|nr:SLC8A2 [Symbiodinium natans]